MRRDMKAEDPSSCPMSLDSFDWAEVFKYGTPDHAWGVSGTEFTREDVAEVLYIDNGANDEQAWIGLFRLKDGRFASIEASCDYTGWG